MKTDFNEIRKNAAKSLNCIIRVLNTEIMPDGIIEVEAKEIEEEMNDIRMHIGAIMCYHDGKDIHDLSDIVKLIDFNPDDL